MKQVNVRLEEDLIKLVKMLAIKKDKSFQDLVKEALEDYLNKGANTDEK